MDNYSNYIDNSAYDEEVEPISGVKRFFFACAGSYMKILEACPSEHTKYVGIGATIFLTACMAVISGSFAIYSLIQNRIIAFFFGLLWGAMIFNLDRYIVSSIRKEGKAWHELGLALPRLILAVLISIVITKPIEVELFGNQINSEMFHYTTQLEKEAEAQLDDRLGLDSIRIQLHIIDSVRQEYKKLKEGKPTSFDFGEVSAEYKTSKATYDSLVKVYTPRIKANEARRNFLWNKYATKVFKDDGNGDKKFVRWDFPQKWQDRSNQLYKVNKRLQEKLMPRPKSSKNWKENVGGPAKHSLRALTKSLNCYNYNAKNWYKPKRKKKKFVNPRLGRRWKKPVNMALDSRQKSRFWRK
jgi:hypothetical protein